MARDVGPHVFERLTFDLESALHAQSRELS